MMYLSPLVLSFLLLPLAAIGQTPNTAVPYPPAAPAAIAARAELNTGSALLLTAGSNGAKSLQGTDQNGTPFTLPNVFCSSPHYCPTEPKIQARLESNLLVIDYQTLTQNNLLQMKSYWQWDRLLRSWRHIKSQSIQSDLKTGPFASATWDGTSGVWEAQQYKQPASCNASYTPPTLIPGGYDTLVKMHQNNQTVCKTSPS